MLQLLSVLETVQNLKIDIVSARTVIFKYSFPLDFDMI